MKLHHTLRLLCVCACLLPAAYGFSRGGETGTLDQEPGAGAKGTAGLGDLMQWPHKGLLPHYLPQDHFRRLRARLGQQALAPIPGWDSRRALRMDDRYFTEDGHYELLPLVSDNLL